MLPTPWGDAHDLRAQALRPGPGLAPGDVERNRRERLHAATVACVAERGYADTTVAQIAETAAMSRSAFYTVFDSKHDCFVATVEEIVALARRVAVEAFGRPASWERRLLAALEAVIDVIVAFPAAARLCYVDAYTAGPEAVARTDAALDAFTEMARGAIAESPERADLPPEVVRAVLGGLHLVVEDHVRDGRTGELPGRATSLWEWGLSYRTPNPPLRRPRLRSGPAGTPRRIVNDPEERILTAFVTTVAERGYQTTTVADVADAASVSLRTFYAHFTDKEDAFLAVLERGRAQALAVAMPAFRRGADWAAGIHAGLRALFAFLAVETGWAHVALDVRSAGARAAAHGQETLRLLGELLGPGPELAERTRGVARTAVGCSVFALAGEAIHAGRAERLPELVPMATFLALAPYIGPDAAAVVANGEGGRG